MRKWVICLAIILFLVVIIIAIFKNTNNVEIETNVTEYVPEEEISEEQNRVTLLTLYFVNPTTKEIFPEVRKVDVKEIMNKPYEKIMNFLIEGSENEDVGKTVPEGTKLNSIKLEGERLSIDLSKEFIEKYERNSIEEKLLICSVVNTFLELQEVYSVSFLIDGEMIENMSEPFYRETVSSVEN